MNVKYLLDTFSNGRKRQLNVQSSNISDIFSASTNTDIVHKKLSPAFIVPSSRINKKSDKSETPVS